MSMIGYLFQEKIAECPSYANNFYWHASQASERLALQGGTPWVTKPSNLERMALLLGHIYKKTNFRNTPLSKSNRIFFATQIVRHLFFYSFLWFVIFFIYEICEVANINSV